MSTCILRRYLVYTCTGRMVAMNTGSEGGFSEYRYSKDGCHERMYS